MSSTVTLERPARHAQASPDQLASGSAPALATIIFDDIDIPSTVPADGTEAPAAAPFTITDISAASWAAAKVLAAQARIAERAELASRYKSKIDQWLFDSCKADEDASAYLSMLLKPYIEAELSRSHSRSRTLHLPTASASLRKSPDHVSVLDEAVAMAYLESNHPIAIVTKKTISLSTVRSLIFTEGEAVPGVEAELGRDSLYLKPRA